MAVLVTVSCIARSHGLARALCPDGAKQLPRWHQGDRIERFQHAEPGRVYGGQELETGLVLTLANK